jgi:protein-S-isoprenylcysteine O-methyltransferase Ste14
MTPASSSWREFRRRGGAWALAQFALMAAILLSWFVPPGWPDAVAVPLALIGVVVAALGATLAIWSGRALGRSMTPLPEPRTDAQLVVGGPYRFARHPMYGGALLFFAGMSLVWSVPSSVLTLALGVLWWRKSIAEERRLAERYPDYEVYRSHTPRRFVPYVA